MNEHANERLERQKQKNLVPSMNVDFITSYPIHSSQFFLPASLRLDVFVDSESIDFSGAHSLFVEGF